jgi:HSP20 family molecular chaperone IbpA
MMSMNDRSITVAVGRPKAEPEPQVPPTTDERTQTRVLHTPLIDIHEGPEGLILEADLPGVADNNVSIQLEDNVLSLHARVSLPIPEGAWPIHEEFHLADYYRSFILSDEVERGQISAEVKNGVLRLNLPKAERAKTRRIEIKS